MNQKSAVCFGIGALILFTSGCVDEASDGSTMTFTYELWVPLSILFGCLLAVAVGWQIRESLERYGWALIIAGPILAMFFVPYVLRARAVVSDTSFSLRGAAWTIDVEYGDLQLIRITSEETSRRYSGRRTTYHLSCQRKDGTREKFSLNNKVIEAAVPHLLERAAELGVPILDQT